MLPFLKIIYSLMEQTSTTSQERSVVYNDGDREGSECFIKYLQMFCEKTASTMKSTDATACSVHVRLMTR